MKSQQLIGLIFVSALLGGCATPASVDQMTTKQSPLQVQPQSAALKRSVVVRDVTGGRETNPMWTSQVSNDAFRRAIEDSLRSAGILGGGSGTRFRLTADMIRLDQPMFGASMTVSSQVRYSLVEISTGKEVYGRVIDASYTAAWNASFLATERLRMANEGSVRENIDALLKDLSLLKVN